jgi:hypothetical protein
MGAIQRIVLVGLVSGACAAQGCTGTPPVDDTRVDNRDVPFAGIIEGTVNYQGPAPCSLNGHIVGDMIVLVFTTSNPPPPNGFAATAANFAVVQGDTLFYDTPRNPGSTLYCPRDEGYAAPVTASAPFIVSPMQPGQYIIQAFYDYYGDFRPNIDIRELPLLGDISGGAIDIIDAFAPDPATGGTTQKYQNPNYQPIFIPIGVGIPDDPNPPPGVIPNYTFPPDNGFLASNITVTVGLPNALTRPYAWMQGVDPATNTPLDDGSDQIAASMSNASQDNPYYYPVISMPQDIQVDALPVPTLPQFIDAQQTTFAAVRLNWGVAPAEVASAVDPLQPFHFQIPTNSDHTIDNSNGGLFVWDRGFAVPETPLLRAVWPFVVFAKLADFGPSSPDRATDPQDIVPQGSATDPIVIIQGITLNQDTLVNTAPASGGVIPASPSDPASRTDHITVLVRPSVVCFNPAAIQDGGVLVTPWSYGPNPGSMATPPALLPLPDLEAAKDYQNGMNPNAPPLVKSVAYGCLPTGRYGVNLVYPTGQAWTLPNVAGSCAVSEGSIAGLNGSTTDYSSLKCSAPNEGRSVLFSQGTRAVIEITPATDPTHCIGPASPTPPKLNGDGTAPPPLAVPDACLPCSQRVQKSMFPECAGQ